MGIERRIVSVFLSTYNGERFIEKQLDSILNQTDVQVHLCIRDDGSSDGTVSIIERYCSRYTNISFNVGGNMGYAMSFMWLVYNCPDYQSDYYAFSDQDDVWDDTKLIKAIGLIESKASAEKAVLYHSDLKVVDINERFIKMANEWEGTIDKYMMLTFTGIRGCSVVYNKSLHTILTSRLVDKIASHDTFVALVAFWTGVVLYDTNSYINYRQTGSNVSITGVNAIDRIKKNLLYIKRRLTSKANERQQMAVELLKYKDYIVDIKDIEIIANYNKTILRTFLLIFKKRFFCHHLLINITNRILILLRKF